VESDAEGNRPPLESSKFHQNPTSTEPGNSSFQVLSFLDAFLPGSSSVPLDSHSTNLDCMTPVLNARLSIHYLPEPSRLRAVNPSALYPSRTPKECVLESQRYTRLTYLPTLLETLKSHARMPNLPQLNHSAALHLRTIQANTSLTTSPNADIGIALSTPTARLHTPTVQCTAQSIYALSSQLKHLSHLEHLRPCALEVPQRKGSITVSSFSAIGCCAEMGFGMSIGGTGRANGA